VTMKTNIISLLSILLVLLFDSSCFSQEKEFKSSWEISISSGQSFVDNFIGAGLDYSTGLTFNPEVTYNFTDIFSTSLSLLSTTANTGSKSADFRRVYSVEDINGVGVADHYQTTLTPTIQFSPINLKKHKLYIGVGPSYTIGNSLLSETIGEVSTTISKNISEFGYLGTIGYKFSFSKNWTIGGKYIYNKNNQKAEHILISLGYKIN